MIDNNFIRNVIDNGNKFLLVSHENPDCDAIGSLLGLGHALKNMGKEVYCYNRSGVPEHLRFIPGSDLVKNRLQNSDDDFDAIFVLDSADLNRVGADISELISDDSTKNLIIIDHHTTNSINFGNVFIDENASSTGILIYRILDSLSVSITPEIAKCLYTTIVGDTGCFQYSNTNPEALRVASKLVEHGADPEEISVELFESEPPRKIRLLSMILDTLDLHQEGKVASLYVTRDMYEKSGAGKVDTEGAVNFARVIKGVKIAILFKEESENNRQVWKVSIRSKFDIDVSTIAKNFGGGGHKKAAGFMVHGNIDEAKKHVVEKCRYVLER